MTESSRISTDNNKVADLLFWALIIVAILPCLYFQAQASININIAWLMTGASRLLEGGTMVSNFYETNPPMSILLYFPPALLSKYLLIPPYYAVLCYTLGLISLFTFAVFKVLQQFEASLLEADDTRILAASYLFSVIALGSLDFGDRDHLLAIALFPFVLIQYALTKGLELPPRLKWLVFILGSILLMVKPHYGIFPTIMLLHRMIVQKRVFSIIKDADFIALAGTTLVYLAIIAIFFRDYAIIISPDVFRLYLPLHGPNVWEKTISYSAIILFLTGILFTFRIEKKTRDFAILLLFAALINLVPYLVQMKGLTYHLLPAAIFFMGGLALLMRNMIYNLTFSRLPSYLVSVVVMVIIINLGFELRPIRMQFPTHSEYHDYEITKMVKNCGPDCDSFFMLNENMAIVHPTAIYSGKEYASRFPSMWFLPEIVRGLKALEKGEETKWTKEELESLRNKYSEMLAEDFATYKPGLVLMGEVPILVEDPKAFDFISFFSQNPAFKEQWQHYKKTDTITINRRDYFKGTSADYDHMLDFDIYRRKD